MKKSILPILVATAIGSLMLFGLLGGFNSLMYSYELNQSFYKLNFNGIDPNYKLPSSRWKIKQNVDTKEYILSMMDNNIEFETYLYVYKQDAPFVLGIWSVSRVEKATLFKDTAELKYYAHLLYNIKVKENNSQRFKVLTN